MSDTNNFWLDEPSVLYANSAYMNIIPNSNMSREEQFNSITRFCIYAIILFIILDKSSLWIFIPVIVICFIIFINYINNKSETMISTTRGIDIDAMGDENYNEHKDNTPDIIVEAGYYDEKNKIMVNNYLNNTMKKDKKINYDKYKEQSRKKCKLPTPDNPFMNPTLNDISLELQDPPIACNADDTDIQNKIIECYNDKLFMDVEDLFDKENSKRQFYTVPQMFPNDQSTFANWCYKSDNICKVDQSKCLKYEDLRFKRVNVT
jgi:hypothetical protein